MKKLAVTVLMLSCVALLVVGGMYIHQSGVLKKYPDAAYLTDEEEAVRPVYRGLSRDEQAVYEALYRGILAQKENVSLPSEVSGKVYSKLYCIIEKQESELFYADSTYYTAEKVREAQIIYRENKDRISEKKDELETAENRALKAVRKASGDYETALMIHDYLIENCEYVIGEDELYGSTAYGCLVEGRANCEGYAKAFNMLAGDLGMESVLVTGITDKGENHAWNQVKIDGEWYNLDVTWDDSDIKGHPRRLYFLCDDEEFGETHEADEKFFEPFSCNSTEDNYYIKNGLYIENVEDAEKVIGKKMKADAEYIELKFADESTYKEFKDLYLGEQKIFDLMLEYSWQVGASQEISLSEFNRELCIEIGKSH